MDAKKTLWLAGVLAVLLGIAIVFGAFKPKEAAMPTDDTSQQSVSYSNQTFGIAFDYSPQYSVQERIETFQGEPLLVVTLIDKEAVVPDMSEGPTAISMVVAQNATNTPLDIWVATHSISNFQLSPDGTFAT
ncbi:hypothetical protein H7X87_00320, partial [Acetobacteraceae bacterium]|nr:hypothetical protein [Candidatus Parcubacteria bacterium]